MVSPLYIVIMIQMVALVAVLLWALRLDRERWILEARLERYEQINEQYLKLDKERRRRRA